MLYQMIKQENTRSQYVSTTNGVDTLNIQVERIPLKVQGFRVPSVRFNLVNVTPFVWTPTDCVDKCSAPSEIPQAVRIIVSGPTMNKTAVIAQLDAMVALLKDTSFDQVWNGFNPLPGNLTLGA